MTFKCKDCKRENLLADEVSWASRWPYLCKECYRKRRREYQKKRGITHKREYNFKCKYGITIEQYEELLAKQENRCASCYREFNENSKPNIDHCHKTKVIRGLLCSACNFALGHLKDSEEAILNLLRYLKQAKSTAQEKLTIQVEGEENVATVN